MHFMGVRCVIKETFFEISILPMIRFRGMAFACLILWVAFQIHAVNPYPQLKEKAERAFAHSEWASASALYDLMLEEKPDIPDTYGQAIVAGAMRGDIQTEMRLMQQALDNHIPFDSVFSRVRQWSFHIGKTGLFENFLLETREGHPWMKRTIDGYLLKYYTFRRDGEKMVAYGKIMLSGVPDNIEFLTVLAEGYMLQGEDAAALAAYETVLGVDDRNFNALVNIGNYYASRDGADARNMAVEYLGRAYAVKATPYVAAQLAGLRERK